MSDNFLGQSIQNMIDQTDSRFFYGLRRTDDGELFIAKVDQLKSHDSIQINKEGDPAENYEDFQQGEDFLEGNWFTIYSSLIEYNVWLSCDQRYWSS